MKVDFNTLYAELGVDPGCDLEELRRAYRRRLSSLHPDRAGTRRAAQAKLTLQQLKQLYDQTLEFHRQFGRLPGSRVPASHAQPSAAPHPAAWEEMRDAPARRLEPEVLQLSKRKPRWMLLLLVVLVTAAGAAFYLYQPEVPAEIASPQAKPRMPTAALEPLAPLPVQPRLKQGMTKSDVLSIQGRPIEIRGEHWWYGPSWLRFQDGELVAWYSSPLHPLRTNQDLAGTDRP